MVRRLWARVLVGVLMGGCVEKVVVPGGEGGTWSPSGDVLLVLNTLSEDLSLVDLATGEVVHPYARAGMWTNRMALDAYTGRIWVVNSGDNALQVMAFGGPEGDGDTVSLGPGKNPYDVGISLRYRKAYVTGWLDHTLTVVDLDAIRVDTSVSVCTNPQGVRAVGDQVLVACVDFLHEYARGGVMALDARTLEVRWFREVGVNPQDLEVDEEGEVYVVATGDYDTIPGRLYRMDLTGRIRDTVAIGGAPGGVSYRDGILVVSGFSGGVVLWDAYEERMIRRWDVDNVSAALLWGEYLVLARFDADRVEVRDTLTGAVVASYPVGDGPIDLLLVPGSGVALHLGESTPPESLTLLWGHRTIKPLPGIVGEVCVFGGKNRSLST